MQPIYATGALSAGECAAWIERLERQGMRDPKDAYPPSYRNNDRAVVDDDTAAAALFARIQRAAPEVWVDAEGRRFRLESLNPRLRGCRYRPGQRFTRHRDGPFFPGDGRRSFLSVVLYLDEGFAGGQTRFFDGQRAPAAQVELRPRAGALAIFPHDVWHEGAEVLDGVKHVLRSDLVYRAVEPGRSAHRGHDGYVWSALPLADGIVLSSGRDGTIRSWSAGELRATVRAASGSVLSLVERDDGRIASITRSGALGIWERRGEALELLRRVPLHHGALVALLALERRRLAVGTTDGLVLFLGPEGEVERRIRVGASWVWGLAGAADGSVLAAGEDGRLTRIGADGAVGLLGRSKTPLRAVAERRGSVLTGDAAGRIEAWAMGKPNAIAERDSAITALAVDPEGRLASGDESGLVEADGARFLHLDFVRSVRWGADGAVWSASYDGTIARSGPEKARDSKVPRASSERPI